MEKNETAHQFPLHLFFSILDGNINQRWKASREKQIDGWAHGVKKRESQGGERERESKSSETRR